MTNKFVKVGDYIGDASELVRNLEAELKVSTFDFLTATDFRRDINTLIDNTSTALFDSTAKAQKFGTSPKILLSKNLLDADFLNEGLALDKVRLDAVWDINNIDTAATYQVTREGSAASPEYQTITMSRIGKSNIYSGILEFADEAAYSYQPSDFWSSSFTLTNSNYGMTFITVSTLPAIVKQINLGFSKTGNPAGNLKFQIFSDNAGSPDKLMYDSNWLAIPTITTSRVLSTSTVLPAGLYWMKMTTDSAYQASYSAGVTQIAWTTGNIKGKQLDLKVKITSGTSDKYLKGFGVYYSDLTSVIGQTITLPGLINSTENDIIQMRMFA